MMNIAVIGAGPAGATIGTLLAREGYHIHVFEKAKSPGPIGAGIMLQRTGMKVLDELGVFDKIKQQGVNIDGFRGHNRKGKKVLSADFTDIGFQGLGIQRGAIFNATYGALEGSNAQIQTDAEVINVKGKSGDKWVVTADKKEHGPFDFVIVANGARSKLREGRKITKVSKPQSWGAVWSLVDSPDEKYNHHILQKYDGTSRMLGFMPVGKLDDSSPSKINFFWGIRMRDADLWRQQSLHEWQEEMIQMAPDYEDIIRKISSKDDFVLTSYHDTFLSPMYEDGEFFIGDAAHAMSPQLSAGTNLALLDCLLLYRSICKHKGDIDQIAHTFYKNRGKQLSYYYKLSRVVTPMFQSGRKIAWIRNHILGTAIKLPIAKGIFIDTIMGVRKSIFSRIDKNWYI